jgi:hypothetical protein
MEKRDTKRLSWEAGFKRGEDPAARHGVRTPKAVIAAGRKPLWFSRIFRLFRDEMEREKAEPERMPNF